MRPDEALWGLPEQLLAAIHDVLQGANWQRSGGKDEHGRAIPRPEPLQRPGVEPPAEVPVTKAVSIDEMRQRLGWDKTA